MPEFDNAAPVFRVNSVVTAAHYYRDVLGFQFDQIHGTPPSFVVLRRAEAEIMLFCGWDSWIRGKLARGVLKAFGVGPRPNGPRNWDAYLRVSDLGALHDEMIAAGARVVQSPKERGGRFEMEVQDPDGRLLCFGQNQ